MGSEAIIKEQEVGELWVQQRVFLISGSHAAVVQPQSTIEVHGSLICSHSLNCSMLRKVNVLQHQVVLERYIL